MFLALNPISHLCLSEVTSFSPPQHYASYANRVFVADLLLSSGAWVGAKDKEEGATPLVRRKK